jgi:MoaA/NifB/PqqE/SkfB family radical SAM enzyme
MISWREIRRFAGGWKAITGNRLAGRTFVPDPRRAIFIETSGRCNLACRFCAYAKTKPGGFMAPELFERAAREAVDLGFRNIYLTPMLGEFFADPDAFARMEHLQGLDGIETFSFFTNFIMIRAEDVPRLPAFGKLREIFISLYGFDAASFELTAQKPARQLEKLTANLHALADALDGGSPKLRVHFNLRTVRRDSDFFEADGPFVEAVRRLCDGHGASLHEDVEYDSWGGTIGAEDVAPLGIRLTDGNRLFMHGTCTKVFGEVQIKASGEIHACACRDMDGSLVIGDLRDASLGDILSWQNSRYRTLIEDQMKGRFSDNCRSCSSYRSVHDHRPSAGDPDLPVIDYGDARRRLGGE